MLLCWLSSSVTSWVHYRAAPGRRLVRTAWAYTHKLRLCVVGTQRENRHLNWGHSATGNKQVVSVSVMADCLNRWPGVTCLHLIQVRTCHTCSLSSEKRQGVINTPYVSYLLMCCFDQVKELRCYCRVQMFDRFSLAKCLDQQIAESVKKGQYICKIDFWT